MKNFIERYSKMNFQVRHGQYGSVTFPNTFSLEAIYYTLHLVTRGLFRHVLESIYEIYYTTP